MKKMLIITQKVDETDANLGFFHRWIEEFARQSQQVTVICLKKGEYHVPDNVRILSLGKEDGASRLKYLMRFYSYIWKYRHEYDVVFVHMNQIYVLLGAILWRVLGKKIGLWYAHGHVSFSLRCAEKGAHYIFTSTRNGFRISSTKKHILGQGIDTALFRPQQHASHDRSSFRMITVGRISPVKDYETLIDAIALLRARGIPASIEIVGVAENPSQQAYLESLRAYLVQKKCTEYVLFVGPVLQRYLPEKLSTASLFVNTSLTGSLDKTGLEAMSMEIPVVTCNESYEEILGPDAPRATFAKKDPKDLAQKIEDVYTLSPQDYALLGERMRRIIVDHHSISNLVSSIIKQYDGHHG